MEATSFPERTTMRINDLYRQATNPTDASAARPATAPASNSASSAGSSVEAAPVTVTVSSKALELSSKAGEASDAKVARLQQAVAEGTFKVDPEAIANKIVEGD
jgi:negative regulator of flagellin synthesis FlgM